MGPCSMEVQRWKGHCLRNGGEGQPYTLESAVRSSAGQRRFGTVWQARNGKDHPCCLEGGSSKSKVAEKPKEGDTPRWQVETKGISGNYIRWTRILWISLDTF
jgi:hypothetical protein